MSHQPTRVWCISVSLASIESASTHQGCPQHLRVLLARKMEGIRIDREKRRDEKQQPTSEAPHPVGFATDEGTCADVNTWL